MPHHSAPRLGSVCPLSGQRGLTGRLRSTADQKHKRGGLGADRCFVPSPVKMWEGACPRWRPRGWPGCWIGTSTYPFLR
ncbi:hypothetical protein CUU62_19900 [Pseudomonas sp. WP001]|nr:hypothetical protein CUU62_19900 [Pseudomonas sp. WP001]